MSEVKTDRIVIACDASTFSIIESCHYKAKLISIDNIRSTAPNEPIEKGSLMHDMLEAYYRAKRLKYKEVSPFLEMPMSEVIEKSMMVGKLKGIQSNLSTDIVDDVVQHFFDYCMYYANDNWQPEDVELFFSRPMYEDDEILILWEGKIDLVFTLRQGANLLKMISDHKTTSRAKSPHPLSNQFIGYCWALECNTVVKNEIGFQSSYKTADRLKRHVMNYPSALIEEWRENTVKKLLDFYYKSKDGMFLRNFSSCDRYGPCQFTELCYTIPEAREWKLRTRYTIAEEPWSPVSKATSQDENPFKILEGLAVGKGEI
jgi:hypothetical protein